MEPRLFALLLCFTLAKMAIAGGIVWLGLRSPERPPEDGWQRDDEVPPPPPPPRPPRAHRSPARSRRPDRRGAVRRRSVRRAPSRGAREP